jgi:branched-subunit amino acid aminotransferase/4-amino-4-deoxychorismate lyase
VRHFCRTSNEVILADDRKYLFEGLSSNFAIIDKDGRLVTAPTTDVLLGTVMEVAKLAAADMGIAVIEEFPKLEDLASCQGAFITSTSRMLLPIEIVNLPDGSEVKYNLNCEVTNGEDTILVLNLQRQTMQKLIERASDITEEVV